MPYYYYDHFNSTVIYFKIMVQFDNKFFFKTKKLMLLSVFFFGSTDENIIVIENALNYLCFELELF